MKKPLCGCLSRSRDEEVQIACKTRGVLRFFSGAGRDGGADAPAVPMFAPVWRKTGLCGAGLPCASTSGAGRDRTERGQERGRAGRGRDGAGWGERSACGLSSGVGLCVWSAHGLSSGSGLCVRPGRYKKAAGSRRDCLPSPKVALLKTTNPNLNKRRNLAAVAAPQLLPDGAKCMPNKSRRRNRLRRRLFASSFGLRHLLRNPPLLAAPPV